MMGYKAQVEPCDFRWTNLCVCVCVSAVILDDFVYTVTVSGQKVFVVKRQHNQQEPISV